MVAWGTGEVRKESIELCQQDGRRAWVQKTGHSVLPQLKTRSNYFFFFFFFFFFFLLLFFVFIIIIFFFFFIIFLRFFSLVSHLQSKEVSPWEEIQWHYVYSRITSTKSPSFCVTTFSANLPTLKVLLPQSHYSCSYVSRRILAPSPL